MANWDVTTAASRLTFDIGDGATSFCYQVDTNHFINFWWGAGYDGFVQVFEVNTSTWAVSTAASRLEYDTQFGAEASCYQVDTNHFINFWMGYANDGFVQVFEVNTSTWAVSTAASRLEYDTQYGAEPSCYQVDDNHFINFWRGADDDGFAQVFEVNTSTWAVSTAASRLEYDTQEGEEPSCCQIDDNHFINFWRGGANNNTFVQVFEVNTSTWAVSTAASRLEYDTQYGSQASCYQVDTNHFINFWRGNAADGYVQVFEVNTSTWAVSTAASRLEYDTQFGSRPSCYQIDDNHFINFWGGVDYDGFVQVFEVNTSTWAVSTAASRLEYDTQHGEEPSCCQIDDNHFINFWQGSGDDGLVQVFEVEVPSTGTSVNDEVDAEVIGADTATNEVDAEVVGANTANNEVDAEVTGAAADLLWSVSTAASRLEFDTQLGADPSCYQIDDNHFINFWQGPGNDGYVQVFEVNTSTWAISTAASRLEYDTQEGNEPSCYQVDTNHFINFWETDSSDGYAQVFEVNTSTWAVSTAASRLAFDTDFNGGRQSSCVQIDTNHFANFWRGNGDDGFVQVFEVNTSTWAISTAASRLEYDTQYGAFPTCAQIDDNHLINFWRGQHYDGFVQVFEVNTSTWAVSTAASKLEFDTASVLYQACAQIDDNHFINLWRGVDFDGFVQVFEVNTSTWAVSTAASRLEFDTQSAAWPAIGTLDNNHFLALWAGDGSDGFAQVFEVDTSTWAVSTTASRLEYDTQSGVSPSCCQIDTNHFINFWAGADGDGFVQILEIYTGTQANNEVEAEVIGADIVNDEIDAEITGKQETNNEVDAEVTGKDTANDEVDAEITGKQETSDEVDAEITGKQEVTNEVDAEVIGRDTVSNQVDAEITGKQETSDEVDAEITGKQEVTNEVDAEIIGGLEANDKVDAEVTGVQGGVSFVDAEVTGKATANNEIDAEVTGGLSDGSTVDAEVTGKIGSEVDAEVTGSDIATNEVDAEVIGSDEVPASSTVDAEVTGYLTADAEVDAEVSGAIEESSTVAAEVTGVFDDVSERQAEVIGGLAVDDEVDAEVTGYNMAGNEVDAEVGGTASTASEIDAEVIGGTAATNEVDAEVTGKVWGWTDEERDITSTWTDQS